MLSAFSSALRDRHALVYPSNAYRDAVPNTKRWPGFIANWRGIGMLVTMALPAHQDLVGSQVIACDGKPVRDLIEGNVFALNFRSEEPGQWWSRAHFLFVDTPLNGLDLLGRSML